MGARRTCTPSKPQAPDLGSTEVRISLLPEKSHLMDLPFIHTSWSEVDLVSPQTRESEQTVQFTSRESLTASRYLPRLKHCYTKVQRDGIKLSVNMPNTRIRSAVATRFVVILRLDSSVRHCFNYRGTAERLQP